MKSSLPLSGIRIDGGTQPRSKIDEAVVAEYAAAMREGTEFPAVVVFHDGVENWLADGFHRFHAARQCDIASIAADIHTGTKRDAILYSVGANAAHGARRTNEDKRRAVTMLLNDPEWSQWSDREIARRCAVDHSWVSRFKRENNTVDNPQYQQDRKFTHHKTGTVSTMRTENIGRRHGCVGAKDEKTELIRGMAEQGFRSTQIAAEIGLDEKTVRKYANDAAIELADKSIGKTHKIDSRRVIEQTVFGMEAAAQSLNTIPVSFDEISASDASEWAAVVAEAMRVFRRFHKQLSETANG